MPFKSKRQWRAFFAMEARGELPKGTAEKWARETKKAGKSYSSLPERKKRKYKGSGTFEEEDLYRGYIKIG
jgi:hypothetical protein